MISDPTFSWGFLVPPPTFSWGFLFLECAFWQTMLKSDPMTLLFR